MPELDLSLSLPTALLLFGVAAAMFIAYLSYRRPVPPLSNAWRSVLGSLRASGLILLVLVLGEPVLSLVRRTVELPVVAVLVDNSRSMSLVDPAGDRRELTRAALRSPVWDDLGSGARLAWRAFDHRLHRFSSWSPDSLTFDGDRTDLSSAFRSLREDLAGSAIAAAVVISDGNSTEQEHPSYEAERLGAPVFTVGVGDSTRQRDVLVASVLSNAVAYARTRVPVNVTVRSSGFSGSRVEVRLRHDGRDADRTVLTLSDGDQRVTLFFTPDSQGLRRSDVSVSALDGELTTRNNEGSFATRVLSGRVNVFLLAGSPGPDVAFISRALGSDSSVSVTPWVQLPSGRGQLRPPTGADLRSTDCLVLVGFPGSGTPEDLVQLLRRDDIAAKPVLAVLSRTMAFDRLNDLSGLLPFTAENVLPNEVEVFASIPESQRLHPLVRLHLDGPDPWGQAPPLFRPLGGFRVKPGSVVLAQTRMQTTVMQEPLIVARSVAGHRSVAILGYGVWRWDMLASGSDVRSGLLDDFIAAAVRWLTAADDQRRVSVRPAKESFSASESPSFSAQVYDESLQPITDADVSVTVQGGQGRSEISLVPLGAGQYAGSGELLAPGQYTFEAAVRSGERVLGTDRGSFAVGGLNVEFLETRMNRSLLEQLAFRTGGAYYDARALDGIAEKVRSLPGFQEREVVRRSTTSIARTPWTLGLVVLIFAVEWFFRKRLGML